MQWKNSPGAVRVVYIFLDIRSSYGIGYHMRRYLSSRIHENLMTEQQNQLDNLKKWLTLTEDRISRLSETVGPDISSLRSQLDSLRNLQADLQNQQKNVDLLSNLVVIVDEGTNDNGNIRLSYE